MIDQGGLHVFCTEHVYSMTCENRPMAQSLCHSMRGIITVLNMPFTSTNKIDHDGLAAHTRYAVEAGVAGFLVPALAAEVDKLTDIERLASAQTVLDAVQGTLPVIGCATSGDNGSRIVLAEKLTQLGCSGILAAIPFTDEADYAARVHELARVEMGFLMLQDWSPAGYGLPLPLIRRLFEEVPVFSCIKIETARAGPKYTEVLEATSGQLHVSGGWAVAQMIEGLDRGVHAFMPTGLHRCYVEIYRRHTSGDRAGALRLFYRLLPILTFSNQDLDFSIRFFKRLLHRQGIYATPDVRPPSVPWDPYQIRIADELTAFALDLESSDDRQA